MGGLHRGGRPIGQPSSARARVVSKLSDIFRPLATQVVPEPINNWCRFSPTEPPDGAHVAAAKAEAVVGPACFE